MYELKLLSRDAIPRALDRADAATMRDGLDLLELGNMSVQLWEKQDTVAKV